MVGTRGLGREPAKPNFGGRGMGMGTGIAWTFESRLWSSGLNGALGWGRGMEWKRVGAARWGRTGLGWLVGNGGTSPASMTSGFAEAGSLHIP